MEINQNGLYEEILTIEEKLKQNYLSDKFHKMIEFLKKTKKFNQYKYST